MDLSRGLVAVPLQQLLNLVSLDKGAAFLCLLQRLKAVHMPTDTLRSPRRGIVTSVDFEPQGPNAILMFESVSNSVRFRPALSPFWQRANSGYL
jgi:hypothetical protein